MSSKPKEEAPSSSKKKFPFFTARKSKTPLTAVQSASKDNTAKIAGLSVADALAKTGAGAVQAAVAALPSAAPKKRKTNKSKPVISAQVVVPPTPLKATPTAAAVSAVKSAGAHVNKSEHAQAGDRPSSSKKAPVKKLAKLFKKSEDKVKPPPTLTKKVKQKAVPLHAESSSSYAAAEVLNAVVDESAPDAPLEAPSATAAPVPDAPVREKAATKIQAVFRGQKERRQLVQRQAAKGKAEPAVELEVLDEPAPPAEQPEPGCCAASKSADEIEVAEPSSAPTEDSAAAEAVKENEVN